MYGNGYYPPMTGYSSAYPMGAYNGNASTGLTLDEAKAWFEQETMGIKRKYLALGAVALGVGYYGYTKGWFR